MKLNQQHKLEEYYNYLWLLCILWTLVYFHYIFDLWYSLPAVDRSIETPVVTPLDLYGGTEFYYMLYRNWASADIIVVSLSIRWLVWAGLVKITVCITKTHRCLLGLELQRERELRNFCVSLLQHKIKALLRKQHHGVICEGDSGANCPSTYIGRIF